MFTVETEIAAYSARCDARRWRVRSACVAPACSHCGVQTANRDGNRDQTEMETEIKARLRVQVPGARRILVWFCRGPVSVAALLRGVSYVRKTEMEAEKKNRDG